MNRRIASRFYWLSDKRKARLFRQSAAFLCVAVGAGAHKVFPACCSAHASRYNMVKRQLGCWKFFAAVLASLGVTGEYIAPVEFDIISRKPVVKQKSDNQWYSYVKIQG